MQEFLQIALSFPTVVFSALLVVLVFYWMLVILGALDLEILDFDLDFDADGEVDFEFDADVDVEAEAGTGFLDSTAAALGLGTVPVTIIATFWAMTAWMISFASVFYLGALIGGISGLLAVLFAVGSVVAAMPITMVIMQPFIQFFAAQEQIRAGDALIGTVCQVTTGEVTDSFGQANANDGGAGLVLSVRCENGNTLTRGSKALIIDYDSEDHVYIIESYAALMREDIDIGDRVVLSEEDSEVVVADSIKVNK